MGEWEGSDNDADLLTFSLESCGEWPTLDDWHFSLKMADDYVNFKLDSGDNCNVISQSLFDRLPVPHKHARQCKAKLKVYHGRRITPRDKVNLVCEYKGGTFTAVEFILIEQGLTSILGLKSCLELGLIKRI